MKAKNPPETESFDAAELGAMMREMRENLGHELDAVARDLRIRLVYLEAIESGRLSDLPGNAYVSGFLRSYSDFLGLEGEEIVRRFKKAGAEISNQPQLHLPSPVEEGRLPTASILVVAAVIAAGAYGGWYYLSGSGKDPMDTVASLPKELSGLVENANNQTAPTEVANTPAAPEAASDTAAVGTTATDTATASQSAEQSVDTPAVESTPPAPVETPQPAAAPATPSDTAETETETVPEPAAASREESAAATPEQRAEAVDPPAETEPAPVAPSVETPSVETPAIVAAPSAPASPPRPAEPAVAPTPTPTPTPAPVAAPSAPTAVPETPTMANGPAATGSATTEPAGTAVAETPPADTAPASPSPQTSESASGVTGTPVPNQTASRSSAASDESSVASGGGVRIVVRATADSYVAVRTSDNQPLFSQLMRRGDSYEVPSGADLVLETGNAGGLQITVGGKRAPSLGPVGEIRRNIPMDAEKLLKGIN